jgi:putative ABC transport system permease protein
MLRKSLKFTAVAVMVFALGIGPNTAIFTVINAVMLRPLPYPNPERLVALYERNVISENPYNVVSPANLADWRKQAQSFEQIAAYRYDGANLSGDTASVPERIKIALCTYNLFDILGINPARGRNFSSEDDLPGATPVVIISDGLWQSRYGASADIIGKQVRLDQMTYTVIGVMPAQFSFPSSLTKAWIPFLLTAEMWANRGNHNFNVIARLRQGVSIKGARVELDGIARRLRLENPNAVTGAGANVALLQERIAAPIRTPLMVLLAAVACVLLIACVNIANLLGARSAARQKEIAVRFALGATRAKVIAQLLVESALLALAGGVLGVGVAMLGTSLLTSLLPGVDRHSAITTGTITADSSVLLFTLLVSLATGLLAGLLPAFMSSRTNLCSALSDASRSNTGGRSHTRFRNLLIAGEVALSLLVLFSAALLLESFQRLRAVDQGFKPERVLTMSLNLPDSRYKTAAQKTEFFEQLLDRVRAMPGVISAGMTNWLPLNGHWSDSTFEIENHAPLPPGQFRDALFRTADPDYFRTMGIPLIRGRFFKPSERVESAQQAIISKSMAETFFPGEDPIGQRIMPGTKRFEIVGIVGDTLTQLSAKPEPTMYFPVLSGAFSPVSLVVKTAVTPTSVALPIEKEINRLDAELPVADVLTMEEVLSRSLSDQRFSLILLVIFAGLALVLACVGLYGVVSHTVTQRKAEIGIRMALGATPGRITSLMLAQGMKPALVGLLIGMACSVGFSRVMQGLLFGATPADPTLLLLVSAILGAVALLACALPARRAARIDPIETLRNT